MARTLPVGTKAGWLVVRRSYGALVLFEMTPAAEEERFLADVAARVSGPFEDLRCDEIVLNL